jgi:hypothetical protein
LTVSDIVSLLENAGVAGLVLILLMTGVLFTKNHVDDLRQDIVELKETVRLANERADSERRRADASVEAAQTANLLLAGIQKGIRSHEDS